MLNQESTYANLLKTKRKSDNESEAVTKIREKISPKSDASNGSALRFIKDKKANIQNLLLYGFCFLDNNQSTKEPKNNTTSESATT